MAVSWTEEQRKVIEYRNRDILVSAAAGSGKTAVLVERIIQKITDAENAVDIDKILVVTFTKAAASEMRERISMALSKCKEADPENVNIDRQMTLLHNAQITTIDSFCLFVVRNHFGEINLEPNFRIADTGEIRLLEMDVLSEVFEQNYAKENNKQFLALIDAYAGKRSDQNVREMVLKLYHMSASDSWPRVWLRGLNELYQVKSQEELLDTQIMHGIERYAMAVLKETKKRLEELKTVAEGIEGLKKYADTIQKDLEGLEGVDEADTFVKQRELFKNFAMGNIAAIRNFDGDEQKKEFVKNGRNQVKEDLKNLKEAYFVTDLDELIAQNHRLAPYTEELIRLTIEYMDAMEEQKSQKRIVDFSDIEHYALRILVDEQTHDLRSTAVEFRNHFEEIMIDEYQDSNQVQEDIMCAISRESIGMPNMFMVGDVKQSIYRFRLARPELFMSKYHSYETTDSLYQKIDLHKNFRSRKEVIDFSNDVFYKIMQEDLGKVSYDEEAALYAGAQYPECDGMQAEVLLFDQKDEMLSEISDLDEEGSKRIEARLVAGRIKKLIDEGCVTDKETGQLRKVRYSDIVILFRSLKDWGTEFASILSECNIPAYVESTTGYFQAYEVQTVLNMIRILDNPYQDIPMAAVLRSPMVGMDEEELSELRIQNRTISFSEVVVEQMQSETPLEGKMLHFANLYRILRAKVSDTPIHELLQMILDMTGFADYAASMPAGERRALNLEMLLEKAIMFEKTSYKGLFHFIRYIDQLQKYEVDFGEADTSGENDDVVRIMTIHKSKGLEFPIVFVCGLGKKMNMRDTSENLVVHSDLGMGLYEMQASPKVKRNSMIRTEIAEQIRKENLGEELRVLYVAFTRAKEKLILTGIVKDKTKVMEKYVGNVIPNLPISFSQRAKASMYLDWVIPAVLSYPEKYEVEFVGPEQLIVEEADAHVQNKLNKIELLDKIEHADEGLWEQIEAGIHYEYPYQSENVKGRKSKYSVSELKHDSMLREYDAKEGEAEVPEFLATEHESYVPRFASEDIAEDGNTEISPGALRGTAVHRVMECLDFAKLSETNVDDKQIRVQFMREEIERMRVQKLITSDMERLVNISMLERFITSNVAKRMALAAKRGDLYREKPFVMDYEDVLVQGIIDVLWIEDGEIVLLDYKTDRVSKAEELVMRYQKQMDLYGIALQKIFGVNNQSMNIKEKIIYSFRLQEEIKI